MKVKTNYHIKLYLVHLSWTGIKFTTLIIDFDCIDRYESNYCTIRAPTTPQWSYISWHYVGDINIFDIFWIYFNYIFYLSLFYVFSDKPQQEQIKSPADDITTSSGINYTWVEMYITLKSLIIHIQKKGWMIYIWSHEIFIAITVHG